jgi:hypothetical protein
MLRTRPLAAALMASFLAGSLARAQVFPPRPMMPPPPPPIIVPPPPIIVPPPPVVYVDPIRQQQRARDRMRARVLTGVGSTVLVLGFFSLVAGIPVLVLTMTNELCAPSAARSCAGYYSLSYGLIGGGVAGMVAGTALDIAGTVYRYRARYAGILGPRFALLPAADGKIGGAAASLAFSF